MEPNCDPVSITTDNIKAIYDHQEKEREKQNAIQRGAQKIAMWAGTVPFILWHVCIFATWILVNSFVWTFDPFPFVLLITVVSLESILLSGFLLYAQNKLATESERQHKLDLQINLLAERESTAILRLLEVIAAKLEIPVEHRKEAQGLSDDTNPTDVLEKIVESEEQAQK